MVMTMMTMMTMMTKRTVSDMQFAVAAVQSTYVSSLLIFAWLEGCWSFGWKPVVLFSATEKTRNSRETSARRLAESLLAPWLAACWSLGWKPVGHSDDDVDDDNGGYFDDDGDDDNTGSGDDSDDSAPSVAGSLY